MVVPKPDEKKIVGQVTYSFEILENVDSVFLDAQNIELKNIELDDKKVKFSNNGKTISIYTNFKKGKSHELSIDYSVRPTQTVYFSGWDDEIEGNEQVWTQGQGKYTSYWLPSFDDMEEKVEFDITVTTNKDLTVLTNGKLITESEFPYHGKHSWIFGMRNPMSSYLLAFAIGDYKKQELKSASGIPIENYYYPSDSLRAEPTYRYTKQIFDFLEKEIGVPYPWQDYKQVPVHDFLYAGMENTTVTIFSDQYVIDSTAFVDKNYVNVNAHEMAHQWFGNLVTEKDGEHHWLHEGFATYYAYLAEQHLFGDDHFYWKLYHTAQELREVAEKGGGQSLLDPKASSLTFYEKGAWALFMLRDEIGDDAFKKGIRSYLNRYGFKNVTVDDFLEEMEISIGRDLTDFQEEWLNNKEFPFEKAKAKLAEKSPSLKLSFDLEMDLNQSQSDDIDYLKYWEATNSVHLKKYMLNYYRTSLPDAIYAKAFDSDTIPVRQALFSGRDLPKFLDKEKLESLLNDKSYITKENALFSLWQAYPEERANYLDRTRNVVGLPNKNIRLMWLTLAILTEGFESVKTKSYFDELSSYTNPEYPFEVRQGAFFYLKEAFGFNDTSLINLIGATDHHVWQFRKYTRDLLNGLLEDDDYRTRIKKLAQELSVKETRYLSTKLSLE